MSVGKNILLRIRIGVGDMIQHDLILQMRPDLLRLRPASSGQPGHAAVYVHLHICRQIFIQIIQTGLGIGDFRQIRIDPVRPRHHPDSRHRKGRQLRDQHSDIAAPQHVQHDKQKHRRHKDRLDQKPRQIVEHRVISGHIRADGAALIIIAHEKFFPVQHLDVF